MTIAALATVPGQSSIGVIRLSGPEAVGVVQGVFSKDITNAAGYTLHHGTLLDGGNALDEVVVAIFRAPRSYTGEDVVEISCHGSPYILRRALALLSERGVRYAQPGEFTRRAFINGKLDLAQAEAVADLIEASSGLAHAAALRQLRGEFSAQIAEFRARLIDFASLIELELDFSEEDVEFARRDQLEAFTRELLAHVQTLLAGYRSGRAIKEGIDVVLAGPPNAGKSSLLNTLLGHERAIVSAIPGTTRDTVEEAITLGGYRINFVDTAGLRETTDAIELLGIARTRQKLAHADITIYLHPPGEAPPIVAADDPATLHVASKADVGMPFGWEGLAVSTVTGEGIEALKVDIIASAERLFPHGQSALVTSQRHYDALLQCAAALQDTLTGIDAKLPSDLLAQSLRQALYYLGEITGQITSDDLLGNIFGRFCIGK